MYKSNNPPAFPGIEGANGYGNSTPITNNGETGYINHNQGMTMRDFFAAAALTGIKSNPELLRVCSNVEGLTQPQAIARMAYIDADAMLIEREKER